MYENHDLADIAYELLHSRDHSRNGAVLKLFPIDPKPEVDIVLAFDGGLTASMERLLAQGYGFTSKSFCSTPVSTSCPFSVIRTVSLTPIPYSMYSKTAGST